MKKYFKLISLFVVFNLSFVGMVFAKTPKWTKRVPSEDGKYKYYVGRGNSAKSEYEAVNEATQDAYAQALRVFGTKVKMSNEVYQTEKEVRGTVRISENVNTAVRFEDFELIDQFIEDNSGNYNVWVLYRFSKDSIEKEKERLKNLTDDDLDVIPFSVYGDSGDVKNGILEVITTPPNSSVKIDNEPYGKTPLKLMGQLSPGKHSIEINNLFYEPIIEDVIIVPNRTIRIEKRLNKSRSKVNIDTYPSGASVFADGISVGKTPIKNLNIETGKTIKLEITHPESFKIIEERTITKSGNEDIFINLNKKPVIVSFDTVPSNVQVYLNDKYIGDTPLKNESIIPKERNEVVLKKDGYKDYKIELTPKGGERIYYPTVRMEKGYGSVSAPSENNSRTVSEYNKNNYEDVYGFMKFYIGLTDYKITGDVPTSSYYDYNDDEDMSGGLVLGLGAGFGVKNFEFSMLFNWRYIDDLEYDFDFSLRSISLNVDYLFRNKTILTPYVGAGVNYDSYESEFYYSTYYEDDNKIEKKNISFSFRVGLRVDISENTSLDVSLEKRLKSQWIDDDINKTVIGYPYWNTTNVVEHINGDYEDTSFSLGYIYKF